MAKGVVIYTVRARFADARVAEEWVEWLRGGHAEEVMQGGARSAEVVRMEGEGIVYEVRYRFGSREALGRYEQDYAPRLRAEGAARFPAERGVEYVRSVGEVVWEEKPGCSSTGGNS